MITINENQQNFYDFEIKHLESKGYRGRPVGDYEKGFVLGFASFGQVELENSIRVDVANHDRLKCTITVRIDSRGVGQYDSDSYTETEDEVFNDLLDFLLSKFPEAKSGRIFGIEHFGGIWYEQFGWDYGRIRFHVGKNKEKRVEGNKFYYESFLRHVRELENLPKFIIPFLKKSIPSFRETYKVKTSTKRPLAYSKKMRR